MQYYRVEITIEKDGTVTEKMLTGYGSGCTDVTAEIEKSLGEMQSQELLSEYHQLPLDQESESWQTNQF